MNFNSDLETIIGYGKSGNDEVYEWLSSESKEELKDFSRREVIESLSMFFSNKSFMDQDNKGVPFEHAEVILFDLKSKKYEKIALILEDKKWKLKWNLNAYKQNK